MTFISFKTYVEFYHTAAWHVCGDVLQDPGPNWEFGLSGGRLDDLVADTGILTFTLDNGRGNAAGLAGYYSIGHANCPAWFVDGLPIRVRCERQDDMTIATRFLGNMVASIPTSGMYTADVASVEARDWMDYAYSMKLGALAIQTAAGLGVDDVLTAALATFPIQPEATSFSVGKESFPSIFDSDKAESTTMAGLFQKYARNEGGGYIYVKGDGTLRFDHRHIRPMSEADAFTLDATASTPMTEIEVGWTRDEIRNRVEVVVYPAAVDTGSSTVLWSLRDGFAMTAGQVITVTCPFVDPDTGARISAGGIVDPLVSDTHIRYGSADNSTSNDLIASLTFPMVVGGNTAEVTLTAAVAGFVNKLVIMGNGIYRYEPMTLEAEDAVSVAARGERVLAVRLEQVTNVNTAQTMADYFLGLLKDPAVKVDEVQFLANFDDAFATAALTVEPNTRFRVKEAQTGVDTPLFACRIRYQQVGTLLWVTIRPAVMFGGGNVNFLLFDCADGAVNGLDAGALIF